MSKGINKFLDLVKLNDLDDDEYDDDLYEDEDEKPARSFFSRKEKTIEVDAEEDFSYVEKKKPAKSQARMSNKVIPLSGNRSSEVYVIKPQEFNESQIVADFLNDGKTIVINMEGIEVTAAQRIIDFISGACYAVNGDLKAISNNIFIATPETIEVSGDLREEILNDNVLAPELGKYRV